MREKLEPPAKEEIMIMPTFAGLTLNNIEVPHSKADIAQAQTELLKHRYIGFDTESKPTFNKGEASKGPHIVQLSTLTTAYIFQLYNHDCKEVVAKILAEPNQIKVGFGLRSDRKLITQKLNVNLSGWLDMDRVFSQQGYRKELGIKAAIATVLGQRFSKSKKATMSNWAAKALRDNQLLYAANDAYAALIVLDTLMRKKPELNISQHINN